MTELIKRLREADTYNKKYYALDPLHKEAADRIEELVKERDDYVHKLMEANNTYTEMHLEIERLSDKLTKAMEALRYYADASPVARAVLAELEEQK